MATVRRLGLLALAPVIALALALLAEPALAQVAVARAEVTGSRLRLEGTALSSRDITVDGVVLGRSDGSGAFRIERDPYVAPADCTVDLNDGSTVTVARLVGCTVRTTPGDTTAPTAPGSLTASLSGTTAILSWLASTDAVGVSGYRVSRNGAVLAGTVTATSFTDAGLSAGTWSYSVTAADAAGNTSAPSNTASVTVGPPPATDTTAPTVPADLTTTVVGSTVGLSWSPSTDATAVTGYRITRNGALRATTNDTTFSDTGLAAGTYSYAVSAFDAAGNTSAPSAAASATVAAAEALGFLTPSALPDATVGQPYLGYVVASDPPGPSTFRFKLVAGRVPAGTQFVENTLPSRPEARVVGTPTAVGTSTFTVEVRDNTGAVARRAFTLRVLAG